MNTDRAQYSALSSHTEANLIVVALVNACQAALSALEANHRMLDPSWDGEASEFSAIGKVRAALALIENGGGR